MAIKAISTPYYSVDRGWTFERTADRKKAKRKRRGWIRCAFGSVYWPAPAARKKEIAIEANGNTIDPGIWDSVVCRGNNADKLTNNRRPLA